MHDASRVFLSEMESGSGYALTRSQNRRKYVVQFVLASLQVGDERH